MKKSTHWSSYYYLQSTKFHRSHRVQCFVLFVLCNILLLLFKTHLYFNCSSQLNQVSLQIFVFECQIVIMFAKTCCIWTYPNSAFQNAHSWRFLHACFTLSSIYSRNCSVVCLLMRQVEVSSKTVSMTLFFQPLYSKQIVFRYLKSIRFSLS